ncbi:MAG: hypothetical protein ACI9UA_004414 [Pseudoalteromonas tetraodonis]|jgi:hypothetical protein
MIRNLLLFFTPFALAISLARAEAPTAQQLEFFENKIRPVLADRCYKCHAADSEKLRGELLLDSRPGWEQGGESGAVIVPGHPEKSLLITALRYTEGLEMPPKSKLADPVIADFIEWIEMGAPDPRLEMKTRAAKADDPFDLEERKKIWSLQPVKLIEAPDVSNKDWPRGDHDRFVLAALEKKGWQPAAPATRQSWLRRVSFDLTGLPPAPQELRAFLDDQSPQAREKVVDRLLGSPHFGEQWARHWMDLVRYAETKAFEADYPMPNAYQYRDYLIRAFNADVPYDQLLREAVAGDLVEPRLNPNTGINESVIGPGYLYLTDGQHGPPDIHEDEARIFDDMIDVLGKAFLSKTVACARCHDHKFDAITAADYYSLYGIIAGSRIDYADINPPVQQEKLEEALTAQKVELRHALADVLAGDLKTMRADLQAVKAGKAQTEQQKRWQQALQQKKPNQVIMALNRLLDGRPNPEPPRKAPAAVERIGKLDWQTFGEWLPSGRAFGTAPRETGDFFVSGEGDGSAIQSFASARPAAGHLSSRFAGSLKSPDFVLAGDSVSIRVKGKNVRVSLYVRHYELLGRGPTTGGTTKVLNSDGWVEHRFNTKLWTGETAYIEVQQNGGQMEFNWSTGKHIDGAYAVVDSATNNTPLPPLMDASVTLSEDLAMIESLPGDWSGDRLSVVQGEILASLFEAGVFDFSLGRSETLKQSVEKFRQLQREVPEPTYVRSLSDGPGMDVPVYIRGSHKNLSKAPNPRHFLDGIDNTPFEGSGSGRKQWAQALASKDNPLTARVMVNRIWHHLFGRGIVASVDDFGFMGDQPSHPELLDHLAAEFMDGGWSIKKTVRELVLSGTYGMSTAVSEASMHDDPDNLFLQHMPVRRLQAEAVRDTVLAVSGQLDPKLYGPSVAGEGGDRRSVYIQLKRRFMPDFLMTFDLPNSTETFGRRNITASPTQSLAMMNSGFVWKAAEQWAKQIAGAKEGSFAVRVDRAHQQAFGRAATETEIEWARGFLTDHQVSETGATKHAGLWRDFCHTMLNRKELIYVY